MAAALGDGWEPLVLPVLECLTGFSVLAAWLAGAEGEGDFVEALIGLDGREALAFPFPEWVAAFRVAGGSVFGADLLGIPGPIEVLGEPKSPRGRN